VEYKNTGEGADTKGRVTWSKQLTDKEAKLYTTENIFAAANSSMPPSSDWFEQIRTKEFTWPPQTK
jgi:hypothetical protein